MRPFDIMVKGNSFQSLDDVGSTGRWSMVIRRAQPDEMHALTTLYDAAFPDEDLTPLVKALMLEADSVLSLVAVDAAGIVGHVVLSLCSLEGSTRKAGLLGPLAVHPDHQRRGNGSALVAAVTNQSDKLKLAAICVLGDPAYYGQFRFARETEIEAPYQLPEAWLSAWQSIRLTDEPVRGRLGVIEPWQDTKYWLP